MACLACCAGQIYSLESIKAYNPCMTAHDIDDFVKVLIGTNRGKLRTKWVVLQPTSIRVDNRMYYAPYS
eukprot:scaffold220341_cov13-Prasinocladus_malaysianus.AAC.1